MLGRGFFLIGLSLWAFLMPVSADESGRQVYYDHQGRPVGTVAKKNATSAEPTYVLAEVSHDNSLRPSNGRYVRHSQLYASPGYGCGYPALPYYGYGYGYRPCRIGFGGGYYGGYRGWGYGGYHGGGSFGYLCGSSGSLNFCLFRR